MELKISHLKKRPAKRLLLMSTSEQQAEYLLGSLRHSQSNADIALWSPGQSVTREQGWHCIILNISHCPADMVDSYLALATCAPLVLIASQETLQQLSGNQLMDLEWLNHDSYCDDALAMAVDMAVLKYQMSRQNIEEEPETESVLSRDAFFQSAADVLGAGQSCVQFQILQYRWVKPAGYAMSWQDHHNFQQTLNGLIASVLGADVLFGRLMDEQFGLLGTAPQMLDHGKLSLLRRLCENEFQGSQVIIYASTPQSVPMAGQLGQVMQQAVQEVARDKLVQEAKFEWQSFEQANVSLTGSMHLALQREEFFLQYQPQLDVASGEWIGAEALIRWKHPTLGILPPSAFIREAENTGLIQVLGRWALHEAIRAWKTIVIDTGQQIRMAVNIAFPQVADESFVHMVMDALQQNEMPAECLELELTETTVIKNESLTLANLQQLLRSGVRISLDDFGTGFSSLSHLSDLPITGIKLDRAFVSPLGEEGNQTHIAAAMVNLAQKLNLETTAEGVEDGPCMEKIRGMGCDRVQGYYFSRPLSLEDLLPAAEQGFANKQVINSGDSAPVYGS